MRLKSSCPEVAGESLELLMLFALILWSLTSHTAQASTCDAANILQETSHCLLSGPHDHQRTRYPRYTPLTNLIGDYSSSNLLEYHNLISIKGESRSSVLEALASKRPDVCNKPEATCKSWAKFRSIDGTCNNLGNPYWGSAPKTFNRFFAPLYSDGYNSPKGIGSQPPYPNARLISTTVHNDFNKPDPRITNMVPVIGQFLDHDVVLTAEPDMACCTADRGNPDCFNIEIPVNDYFYSNLSTPQRCMDFTRSTAYCFPTISGVREQFSINTAYVDASQVYGSDRDRAKYVRAFTKGQLAVDSQNSKLIVTVAEAEKRFGVDIPVGGKFLAGDNRVNEMPALTAVHTLMVHEHNRIASQIAQLRPRWNDDKIYDETRRIVGAEWQNIVYGQFLSAVLGEKYQMRVDLQLCDEEVPSYSLYNPTLDGTIFHEFSTAAYRFGHTLLNGLFMLAKNFQFVGSFLERDNFFTSEQLERNNTDGYNLILGGLMLQTSQGCDRWVSEDFTNFLFKFKEQNYGSDLVAKNLQRSRDHAIENYNKFRKMCGLESLTSWFNKPKEISLGFWEKLRKVYKTPQQIELFSGGISESPVSGSVPGPTFSCIIALQFYRLKFGDRYFFTHENQPGSYSLDQIKNIRKRTLGDIICENSNLQKTTRDVFRTHDLVKNPWINCNHESRERLNVAAFLTD